MYTLAQLQEFGTWVQANMAAGPRKQAVFYFLKHAGNLLIAARRDLASASASGQFQRTSPPSRETVAADAVLDANAVLEALDSEPAAPTPELEAFAAWAVPLVPAGQRRTQFIGFLTEVGVLEHPTRTRFVSISVQAQQQRATPPSRSQLVLDAIADANALIAALGGLADAD